MGIFDKAKDLIGEHNEKIDQAIDKAGDLVDQKTGGAHGARIDQGSETLKGHLDRLGGTPDAAADVPTTDAPTTDAPTTDVPTTDAPDAPATRTTDGPPPNEPAAGPPVS